MFHKLFAIDKVKNWTHFNNSFNIRKIHLSLQQTLCVAYGIDSLEINIYVGEPGNISSFGTGI